MHEYYFTFRSITRAQKAEQVLLQAHLHGRLLRAPKFLSVKGCGYALRIRAAEAHKAAQLFRFYGVNFTAIYFVDDMGNSKEVFL